MSEPAFPYFHSESCGGVTSTESATGLTKRELFAAMAMQGLIANQDAFKGCHEAGKASGYSSEAALAVIAAGYADALLAELEKPHA